MSTIPVAKPALAGNEFEYVKDCMESGWISSAGSYVDRFEDAFARFTGRQHALSCINGTAALHLALAGLDVGAGDEVLVPTLTFVATANAVTYCGATPVFIDSEPDTWNIDPTAIEGAITPRTRGIVVVHLYGHPVDMDPVLEVARRHGLFVIEDAAEAHGALYRGRPVGSMGDAGVFSFYGNKILTTGEGGMVVTNDRDLATRVGQLRGQGLDPERRYWFPIIGYNYRMTNIAAAIGLAQVEKADWHLARRQEIRAWYAEALADIPELTLQPEAPWARHAHWMVTVLVEGDRANRDAVMKRLESRGIETRPVFFPMHTLPPYREGARPLLVAEEIAKRGMNLPTWAEMSRAEVDRVCQELVDIVVRGRGEQETTLISASRTAQNPG